MEINKILRNDWLDKRITTLLNGDYVYKLHKPEQIKTNIYIEYLVVREEETNFCGNDSLENEYLVQIDVFGQNGSLVSTVMSKVKEVLKEKGYRYDYGYETYEEDTKLYSEKIRIYKEISKEMD